MKHSYRNLFPKLAVEQIEEQQFYNIVLELLEYQKDIHFHENEAVAFAQSLGLNPLHKAVYDSGEMEEKLCEALKINNRFDRNCMEYLAENGALDRWNEGKPVPEILEFDGKLQPIFDFKESIFEKVYVESPQDTDSDGQRDLIAVYIRRPKETLKGMKVPAFYIANPYMLGGDDDSYVTHNVDLDLPELKPVKIDYEDIRFIPENKAVPDERVPKGEGNAEQLSPDGVTLEAIDSWYQYFVSRGYAAVFSGGIGTRGSDGIRSTGSVDETISTIAVIEWLNGRRRAFTNKTDCIEVKADWCTGKTAMNGKSYLGTLCVAAAATGVDGLRTIIPEAFITNWYNYYRCHGVTAPALDWQGDDADLLADYCFSRRFDPEDYAKVKDVYEPHLKKMLEDEDRVTGNYNRFWDERNYLNHADKIKCSVFGIQGLNDWNVKPLHAHQLWQELQKNGVPCKLLLHQGDHIYINNLAGIDFNSMLNRWLAYWLYDIDNDVMNQIPNVMVENNLDCTQWDCDNSWPFEASKEMLYGIKENGDFGIVSKTELATREASRKMIVDDISLTGFNRQGENYPLWRDSMCMNPEESKPYRLVYTGAVLDRRLRINGEVKISFNASINAGAGILSAMLIDYGSLCRYSVEQRIIKEKGVIWGRNTEAKDLVYFVREKQPSPYKVITRGCMSAKNRTNDYSIDEVKPGKEYTFSFTMVPMDYTLEIGHQLGLIICGADAEVTQRPLTAREITVDENSIQVEIPMISDECKKNYN